MALTRSGRSIIWRFSLDILSKDAVQFLRNQGRISAAQSPEDSKSASLQAAPHLVQDTIGQDLIVPAIGTPESNLATVSGVHTTLSIEIVT